MTTTDPRAWLTEAQARANNATEGPWTEFHENGTPGQLEAFNCPPATGAFLVDYGAGFDQQNRDAKFIAHARTEHPAMAAALTAVLDIHVSEPCEPECGQHDLCAACWDDYPCATVRAITDHLKDTK